MVRMTLRLGVLVLLGTAALTGFGQGQQQTTPLPSDRGAKPAAANSSPELPAYEIIRRFAAKEQEFRQARDNYTYTQTVHIQEFDMNGHAGGEFNQTSDIIFTPEGKRYEKITYAPPVSLRKFGVSREDLEDIANIQPFVLTSQDLGKYDLEYQGRERVDELGTYVFSVHPRRLVPGQRYFEGKIWVEDEDLQIVKTYGKAVPDIHSGSGENLFPRFETYRENIDGKYWFPTYTRANDTLHFRSGPVRIRMIVRYTNYKQFKATTRILDARPLPPEPSTPPDKNRPQPPQD